MKIFILLLFLLGSCTYIDSEYAKEQCRVYCGGNLIYAEKGLIEVYMCTQGAGNNLSHFKDYTKDITCRGG